MFISKDDLVKAQKEENWIKTVKHNVRNKKNSLDKESISSSPFQLWGLIKKPKLQPRNYLPTTYCDSECQGKSSMIQVVVLEQVIPTVV